MQPVSQEYKESMKSSLRNRGYIRVIFGFDDQVQYNVSGITGDMSNMSDTSEIFKQGNDTYIYASLEKDFMKIGYSGLLFPPTTDIYRYERKEKAFISKDFISEDNPAVVTISFNTSVKITKMIINFGENYPVDFDITYNNDVFEVRDNDQRIVEIDNDFGMLDEFLITAIEMKNEDNRLRIYSIDFESHLIFDNEKVIDSTLDNTFSPINETLPQKNFSVTLVNENHQFDVDNEKSELNLLDTNTKVTIYYGYQLDDESIEWIKYEGLYAYEWDADEDSATVTARDILQTYNDFDYMNGTFSGTNLYNLAVAVFNYMGINNYHIDEDLKTITIANPLPIVGCKECLQLIANAACKTLLLKGNGKISIGGNVDANITSNGDKYGNLQQIKDDSTKYTYTELEDDLIKIGENILFLYPPNSQGEETGFISTEMSSNSGYFVGGQGNLNEPENVLNGNLAVLEHTLTADEYQSGENPYIDFTFEEDVSMGGLRISFGASVCEIFTIHLYRDGEELDSYTIENNFEQTVTVNFNIFAMDKIRIEFVKTVNPRNRVRVNRVELIKNIKYTISNNDILGFAKFSKFSKIREITVPYYSYQIGLTEEKIGEMIISEPDLGEIYKIQFNEPCGDYRLSVSQGMVTILESSAYWVKYKFSQILIDSSPTVIIYGKKYTRSENIYTITLNDDGVIVKWENPLICNKEMAENLANYLAEYYNKKGSYSFEFRGDPALEINDTVKQEHYSGDLDVLLTDISFRFNGAFSGNLTTLRLGGAE